MAEEAKRDTLPLEAFPTGPPWLDPRVAIDDPPHLVAAAAGGGVGAGGSFFGAPPSAAGSFEQKLSASSPPPPAPSPSQTLSSSPTSSYGGMGAGVGRERGALAGRSEGESILAEHPDAFDEVRLVAYSASDADHYEGLLDD